MSNDTFAEALSVVILDEEDAYYLSLPIDNSAFGLEASEPGAGYRSAWWTYEPQETGTVWLETTQTEWVSGTAGTKIYVYEVGPGADTLPTIGANQIAFDDNSGSGNNGMLTSVPVTAGKKYYIRVSADSSDGVLNYRLYAYGPPTAVVPPLEISAPAALVEVVAPAPTLVDALVTLLAPIAGTLTPVTKPQFSASLTTIQQGVSVEFQYADDRWFTDPTSITVPVLPGLATTTVFARPAVNLADDTIYYWRARVVNDYAASDWTAESWFVTSFFDGDALIGGIWEVGTGTVPAPHLWYITPPRGYSGDTAVAVGTGFGPNTVLVSISGVDAPVSDFDTIAPNADAYTEDRVIDTAADEVSPGHQRVTFTVPEGVRYPGGLLYVDGS